jgi:hypothetical protein
MDDQRTDRKGGDGLMANVWLIGVLILVLVVVAFIQGVHAWDGGSYIAAAWAVLAIACIFVLSLNIARRWKKK